MPLRNLCLSVVLLLPLVASAAPAPAPPDPYLEHARAILKTVPLIDGHNDLSWSVRSHTQIEGDLSKAHLDTWTSFDTIQTDIPRLRQGEVGAQFWSVWVPSSFKGDAGVQSRSSMYLEQADLTLRMIEAYPRDLELALSADDILRAFRHGKIASLLGIEGGSAIDNSLGALRAFYRLGVRYMILTHVRNVDWADSANDVEKHGGLTPFGKEVVREMNRLGMLVDISHVSEKVMNDALDVTEAPVIFSHSSARSVTSTPRNVPDDVLRRMTKNGGIVMVTFVPDYVSEKVYSWSKRFQASGASKDSLTNFETVETHARLRRAYAETHPEPKATVADVADHVDYIRRIAGVDHIGIGSDFCGLDMPEGLEDASQFPNLFAELLRRGWSEADLRKLAGENFLRVFRAAADVAARLQKQRPPSLVRYH